MTNIHTRTWWAARDDNGSLNLFNQPPHGTFDNERYEKRGGDADPIAVNNDLPGFEFIRAGEMHQIKITIEETD